MVRDTRGKQRVTDGLVSRWKLGLHGAAIGGLQLIAERDLTTGPVALGGMLLNTMSHP